MKKFVSILLALTMLLGMVVVANAEGVAADKIKIGMICIGDENEGYTANHVNGLRQALKFYGIDEATQVIYKWNIPETEAAYDAAIDLAEQGCDIIFANSFGHEAHLFLAAEEYPDIEFCHATGISAASTGLTNTHNFFPAVCEARYVSGIVAGMKLNQMIADGVITAEQAKMGYVAAKPFAEVISGYTAFYLGARSVCPSVTMEVIYTGEWSAMALEQETAEVLIGKDCVLISQHSDTVGPATACEAAGVPIVGYNISMIEVAGTMALTSPACNWGEYFTFAVGKVLAGETFAPDWWEGYAANAVRLTELNPAAVAPGTAEAVAAAEEALRNGTLYVFDTATFTVGGETVTSCVRYGTEYIKDGRFMESELCSAPQFDLIIDGITVTVE